MPKLINFTRQLCNFRLSRLFQWTISDESGALGQITFRDDLWREWSFLETIPIGGGGGDVRVGLMCCHENCRSGAGVVVEAVAVAEARTNCASVACGASSLLVGFIDIQVSVGRERKCAIV